MSSAARGQESFDSEMYDRIREGCRRSAAVIVPYVYDLVKPDLVADVGGGEGWWAREFARQGCRCVVYDESVEAARSEEVGKFGQVRFERISLTDAESPLSEAHFDLAVCLEVAEHLPAAWGEFLVRTLCALAPVVLWSAAIPAQGGHGHVNEQWPAYWAKLFRARNYVATDFRDRFWDDDRIEPWYRQNLLVFASLEHDWTKPATYGLAQLATGELRLAVPDMDLALRRAATTWPLSLVHPDIYGWRVAERDELLATKADSVVSS